MPAMFVRSRGWVVAALFALCAPLHAQTPGAYIVQADAVVPMSAAYTGLNCNDLYVAGTLLLGSGEIEQANAVDVPGIFDAGSGSISVGGNWSTPGIFLPGSSSVRLDGSCSGGPVSIAPSVTFCRLELGSGVTYLLPPGTTIQVECELDLGDDNQIVTDGPGESAIVLGPGAEVIGDAQLDRVLIARSGQVAAIPVGGPGGFAIASLLMLFAAARGLRRAKPCFEPKR